MWCGGDYVNCWRGDDYNNGDGGCVKIATCLIYVYVILIYLTYWFVFFN